MIFRQNALKDPYIKIEEKIKSDLILTLRKKGVGVSRIQVDIKPDRMNLEVGIIVGSRL